ncbi:hypothetical protein ACLB1R_09100 [Escherichia coli]
MPRNANPSSSHQTIPRMKFTMDIREKIRREINDLKQAADFKSTSKELVSARRYLPLWQKARH